jgi:hypothetical protein
LLRRSTALVPCLCAALAVGSCAARRSETGSAPSGTTSVVIPRLLGLDVANAVAEVRYLHMISALVDGAHRPIFDGVRDDAGWTVIKQDPRPGTEVAVSDLTVTITITVGCRSGCRGSRRTTSSRRTRRSRPNSRSAGGRHAERPSPVGR